VLLGEWDEKCYNVKATTESAMDKAGTKYRDLMHLKEEHDRVLTEAEVDEIEGAENSNADAGEGDEKDGEDDD